MSQQELFLFIQKFCKVGALSEKTIQNGFDLLPPECHELFALLINYKNGAEFDKLLKDGDL